ncbi:MAG: 23S rRNA (adenine(2503)-C(2))-methyltransferase RlmN [Acholeplasmatales bacterium]|nr:MAG: 23S rRNA (adenine(2503)-C(2))-methyltransferase RlmN [Acholeplasmatales bacterium]
MRNLYGETIENLKQQLIDAGFKAYHARQIFEWLYKHQVQNIEQMANIGKTLRQYLKTHYTMTALPVFTRQCGQDGTCKYLFKLHDEHLIETVLMRHDYGKSLCITTQVGCNIGCAFCASGLQKRIRNLTPAEMVLQVMGVIAHEAVTLTHIVIMGTGEPFDNFDNVMDFIDIVNAPYGLEIGARHITVSTSGIVPKILAFAERPKQVNLAISLHAPNNTIRSRLMKINDVWPIETLLDSVKTYIEKTGRRVTFEYILMRGVNDSLQHADALSDLLRGMNAYVNLIRYNAIDEFSFKSTPHDRAKAFHDRLLKRGIQATLRREMGADIDAACGQLRAKTDPNVKDRPSRKD